MVARETVHEVLAGVALAVDVPKEAGSAVQGEVIDALTSVSFVRSVTVDDVHGVDETETGLQARIQGELTLHFPASEPLDAETSQERLAAATPILKIN